MSAPDARALFAAARDDGPDPAAREAMFREIARAAGVATATGVAASALVPTSSAAAKAGGAVAMKLVAGGVALGALVTGLGVLFAMTVVMPEPAGSPGRVAQRRLPATTTTGARLAQAGSTGTRTKLAASASAEAKARADVTERVDAKASADASGTSDLGEEAQLVTAARKALMSGDPAKALALVQDTRKLSARSLEPEELGLECRALRALGRADDAAATELVLRRRYPDHALAH